MPTSALSITVRGCVETELIEFKIHWLTHGILSINLVDTYQHG